MGRPRTSPRVPAAGREHSAVSVRPPLPPAHPPGDTQASCCVSLFPVAMSYCTQSAARSQHCGVPFLAGEEGTITAPRPPAHGASPLSPVPKSAVGRKDPCRLSFLTSDGQALSGSWACCTQCEGVKQDSLDSP